MYTTVGGGLNNIASSYAATGPGSSYNTARGNYSFAAGRRAQANSDGCFVWGDSTDANVACNNNNHWVARASGGVYSYTNSGLTTGVYVGASGGSWSSVSDREIKENLAGIEAAFLWSILRVLQSDDDRTLRRHCQDGPWLY